MKRVFATAAAVLFAALTLTSCMFLPPHAGGSAAGGNAGDSGAAAGPAEDGAASGSLFGAGEAASEAGAASAAPGDDGYVAEANRIAMEFVDGPTGRYLKGELSEDAFKAEAAAARDALLDNAREALTALGFSGAELEELMAAETEMIGDVYLCVEDVMRPARELAALEALLGKTTRSARSRTSPLIGELTAAGKSGRASSVRIRRRSRRLKAGMPGGFPRATSLRWTSKTQADQYADDLDMGDFSSLFPQG
ncbi:MAG: hypothetical protein ACLVL7_14035 [Anaerotruncus massiliensis (ex Togo et al. 2019)]